MLQHSATSDCDEDALSWTVVPDTGTDELAGIRGGGQISIDGEGRHTFTLDDELP